MRTARDPKTWIVLCRSAYGGASRGVEGLEFTGDVGPGGLVDDFGDAVGGEFADAQRCWSCTAMMAGSSPGSVTNTRWKSRRIRIRSSAS